MSRRAVVLAIIFAAASASALDVTWQQSSWLKTYTRDVAADLSDAHHYTDSDGRVHITGTDHRSNNYIILSPDREGHIIPYVTNYPTFTTATLSTYVSPGYLVQQYDQNTTADGNGSIRYGYTATASSASAYLFGRYLYSYNKHIAITEHTNLFVLFMHKSDAFTLASDKFNLLLQYGNDAWSWTAAQYISNFSFPSRDWTLHAGQINISTNVLRNAANNPSGTITASHRMVLWFNVGNLIEHPTASVINPISNSVWMDNVMFVHAFETNGMVVSAPFAAPQYHLSAGTVYRMRTIKAVTIGGFIGQTNTNGYGCMMITNHADPNRYSPGAVIRMQIRSGTSYDDIRTKRWAGSNGYDTTALLVNGFTNTSTTANLTAATNLGLIASNAAFYQYRASLSSRIQGVTPVLTNIAFTYTFDPTAETSFRQPYLLSRSMSGNTLILAISNFYDPIVTRIDALNNADMTRAPLSVLSYDDAPFSSVRHVVLDLSVPFGEHSLLISNQNDPNPVIVTNAFLFAIPPVVAIDTSPLRRAYIPSANRLTFTVRCNIAGSRTLTFDIYNTKGTLVHRHSGNAVPGENSIDWESRGRMPSGVYLYHITLRSENGSVEQKRGMFAVVK